MGEAPPGLTLERIDNDAGYSKGNCRWATRFEQQRNKRSNRRYELDGVSMLVVEWEEKLGLSHGAIWHRLKKGWALRDALSKPSQRKMS
jgi:hypothetical protein